MQSSRCLIVLQLKITDNFYKHLYCEVQTQIENKLFIFSLFISSKYIITSNFLMVSSGLLEKSFVLVAFSEFQQFQKLHLAVNFLVSLEWLWVATGLHSYRSFVLLRPSSEDCLQSVCTLYWLSLWMKYPFDLKTYHCFFYFPFLLVRTLLLNHSNRN